MLGYLFNTDSKNPSKHRLDPTCEAVYVRIYSFTDCSLSEGELSEKIGRKCTTISAKSGNSKKKELHFNHLYIISVGVDKKETVIRNMDIKCGRAMHAHTPCFTRGIVVDPKKTNVFVNDKHEKDFGWGSCLEFPEEMEQLAKEEVASEQHAVAVVTEILRGLNLQVDLSPEIVAQRITDAQNVVDDQ